MLIGVVALAAAIDAGNILASVILAVIGFLIGVAGVRMFRGFYLAVDRGVVELRWGIKRRRIACRDISSLDAKEGSEGLIYRCVYPTVTLANGSCIPFNAVQWPRSERAYAKDVCEKLTRTIIGAG